jgi:hypothetical protein
MSKSNQMPAFRYLFPGELHRNVLILPAILCDNMYDIQQIEMLSGASMLGFGG